jgi:hypothetical protein
MLLNIHKSSRCAYVFKLVSLVVCCATCFVYIYITMPSISRLNSVVDKMTNAYEAVWGIIIGRGNRHTRRKPAPLPFCPLLIPHDLTCNPTRGHSGGRPATNHLSCSKANNRTKRTSQKDSVDEILCCLTFKQSVYSYSSNIKKLRPS